MTETFNLYPDNGIPWSQPAPLHVAMIREAKEAYKATANAKDEARKHLLETKA